MQRIAKYRYFKLATIGGTFNALHQGHLEYLSIAFNTAQFVHIYLTTDELAKNTKLYTPLSFQERLSKLSLYLQKHELLEKCEIIPLINEQQLEKSIVNENYDLAVVEPAYFKLFESFNYKKTVLRKPSFCIIYKPRTKDNLGKDISSTRLQNKIFKQTKQSSINKA